MTYHKKTFIGLFTAAFLASSLLACSSDSEWENATENQAPQNQGEQNANQAPQNQGEQNQGEQNTNQAPQNQGEENATNVPQIDPLEAAHVIVEVSPTRFSYEVGESITPSATVYDEQWREIDDAEVEWSASPSDAAEPGESDQWVIREGGTITFQACAVEFGEATSACGERSVSAASGLTAVVLERPVPGEHFKASEDPTIPVEGSVHQGLPIDTVQVNGETVTVDDEGRFTHQINPDFGINTVFVRAFDGTNPADGIAAASVMWAPEYQEPDVDSGNQEITAELDEAFILRLGQNFLDDGEPYTEIPEVQITTHDLADLLQLVLEHVDIADEISNPVVDSSSVVLSIPDTSINDPTVELHATDDGLVLFGQIPDLHVETEGFIELSEEVVDLEGSISAMLSLHASIEIEKPDASSPFHVELEEFELAVEQATPDFNSEEANAIFELADSMLRDNIEDIILEGVDLSFIDQLPEMLLDVLDSLDETISGQEFDVELDFGEPLSLSFDGQVEQFNSIRGQGLEGFVSANLTTDGVAHFPDNPGVALMDADPLSSPLFSQSRVQLALDFALVNSIFHNLWNAGLLDLDVTDLVEENFSGLIESGHVEGLLPPVLAPPTGNSPHDLVLHLGQLEFELEWVDQTDRFAAELEVGANLDLVGDEVSLQIADDPEITLWLIESTENHPVMDTDDLLTIVDVFLWPEVEEMVGDSLSLSIPIPEIDALTDYSPDLADLTLNVRTTRPIDARAGYLILDAAVEGELMLP